jgi:hypothetical protein
MSCGLKTCTALAAFFLAVSPSWAMSVVTVPANNDAASRFTDPNAQPQRGFSGAITTVIIGGGSGSFGYGGSATAGSNTLDGRFLRPGERPRSDLGPSFPDHRLPDSYPYGFNQTDPFAGPRDPFAPDLRGNSR